MPPLQISAGAGFPVWTKFSSLGDFSWLMRFGSKDLAIRCIAPRLSRKVVFEIRISPLRERAEFYQEV